MKIVSIKFLNLNSLKGEHTINFDRPPFVDSGLFAITGPTGAGKTTILDAITVALYARVHRHNKDVDEIMTRHTAECYSELEFEVKGARYRSKWSLRRSRGKIDGAMQGEKMELSEVATGKIIGGHTPTLTRQAIVDLCGLDYNQFLRSVILSQGDFTRFLRADDNERSELLEKITDTMVYSDISKFVFDTQRQEREKLESLAAKLDNDVLLSDDNRLSLQAQSDDLHNQISSRKKVHASLAGKLEKLRQLAKLKERSLLLSGQLVETEAEYQNKLPSFEKLRQHTLALAFEPALVEIATLNRQMNEFNEKSGLIEAQLPELIHALEKSRQTYEESILASDAAQNELTQSEPLLERVRVLDDGIVNQQQIASKNKLQFAQLQTTVNSLALEENAKSQTIYKIREQIEAQEKWLSLNDQDQNLEKLLPLFKELHKSLLESDHLILETSRDLEKLANDQRETKYQLEDLDKKTAGMEIVLTKKEEELILLQENVSGASKKSLEELEASQASLPELISICERQLRFASNFKSGLSAQSILRESLAVEQEADKIQAGILSRMEQELQAAEDHLLDLRKLAELQQRIQKYEDDRQQLLPGQSCPLCGSLEHPYISGKYNGNLNEAETKREAQVKKVSIFNNKLSEQRLNLGKIRFSIEQKGAELAKVGEEQEAVLEEFNRLNLLLPKPLDIEKPEVINAVIRDKTRKYEELKTEISKRRALNVQISTASDELNNLKQDLLGKKGQFSILEERMVVLQSSVKRLELQANGRQEKRLEIVSAITGLLAPYAVDFDINYVAGLEDSLYARSLNYSKQLSSHTSLKLEFAGLNAELIKIGEALAEKLSSLLTAEMESNSSNEVLDKMRLERNELFQDRNPLLERGRLTDKIEKARRMKDKAQEDLTGQNGRLSLANAQLQQYRHGIESTDLQVKQLDEDLHTKLLKVGISSKEELRIMFLPEEEASQLSDLQKNLESTIAALNQNLSAIHVELLLEEGNALGSQTEEELLPSLQATEASISALNQEIGKLNQILLEDSRLKDKHAALTASIQIQKVEYERWAKISSLIGSADGKKFSRFAQGLTLARLTDLANRHLAKLSDRYLILKSDKRDLELLIVDGHQADVIRPMATLSGGESFLVSLALALGLSDLASRKVQINSLFIDEGFGTLDSDTLDIAISALENLQARGKSIGIISHVEALKDRIGTQIRIVKQPGGSSKITVLSYMNEVFEA